MAGPKNDNSGDEFDIAPEIKPDRMRLYAYLGAVLLFAGMAFGLSVMLAPAKRTGPKYLAVDGDPRMTICRTGADSPFATPELAATLGLSSPLTLANAPRGHYRISVLRPVGRSISVDLLIGDAVDANHATITTIEAGQKNSDSFGVDYIVANPLVAALRNGNIWGQALETLPPRHRLGEAGAVIEMIAPSGGRCVATRYDDERVAPILSIFASKLVGYQHDTRFDGFVPEERTVAGAFTDKK